MIPGIIINRRQIPPAHADLPLGRSATPLNRRGLRLFIFFWLAGVSVVWPQAGSLPFTSVRTMDGAALDIDALLSEGPVLIDFWALWCSPCLKAMRHLDQLQAQYGPAGFSVLAVNIDSERSRSKVRSYIKSRGYRFTVVLDPSQDIYRHLNGQVLPYSVLLDRSGGIVYRLSGYMPGNEQALEQQVAALLADDTAFSP